MSKPLIQLNMKTKQIFKFFVFLLMPTLMFAQSRQLSGTVLDENQNPLPGASIIIKGTKKGASTDFDGIFTIKVPNNNNPLVVSYIGYTTQEIKIVNSNQYVVIMVPDANKLDEVVITGYGSLEKREMTGATGQVKESEEVASQYNNVSSMLQGRVAGVAVNSNIGTPGAAVSVRIRGTNSLRGNNEPLYVVDGVIMASAGQDVVDNTDGNETQTLQNGLTGINPRDIESMVILKDAASTALYGSRGANGVVLITTKQGTLGKAKIELFTTTTVSQVSKKIPVLNGTNYAQLKNEMDIQNGFAPSYIIVGDDVYLGKNDDGQANGLPQGDPLRQVNWQDEIYEQGLSYSAGATISGATEESRYYVSGDINQIKGVTPNEFLNTANFRTNYNVNVSDRLKIGSKVSFYYGRGSIAQSGSKAASSRSLTRNLFKYNPLVGGQIEDGEYDGERNNPYAFIKGYEENIREKRAIAAFDLNYEILEGFNYQLRAGMNYRNKYRSRWYGKEINKGYDLNGDLGISTLEKLAYTFDNIFTYRKNFSNKHRLNVTGVITYDGSDAYNTTYEVADFAIDDLRDKAPQLGAFIVSPLRAFIEKQTIFSYLARVNYTFNNKYVFNGAFRSDTSSKFKPGNKTGYFPSFSLAWRIAKENFLKNSDGVNELKFRASWGLTGNQGIRPYQTFSNFMGGFYVDSNNSNILSVFPENLSNSDLTWETTAQLNLGLDFGFFNNRLSGSFDIYEKETTNLLMFLPAPPSTGFSRIMVNQGGISNKGLEVALQGVIVEKNDLSFSIGGNISVNRPIVTGLGELPKADIYNYGKLEENVGFYYGDNVSSGGYKQPANIFAEGHAIGTFYGYMTDGIYKTQEEADNGPTWQGNANLAGDVKYVDLNGDGNVNDSDRSIIGDPTPDFTYGVNADLVYKNFSVSMLFTGSQGNEILNGNLTQELVVRNGSNANVRPEAYFDAWSPDNINGAFPRLNSITSENVTSDRLVEDASYFRLSNVTIGYDFILPEDSALRQFKLFAAGNNLFTITDYMGYDPSPTTGMGNGSLIGVDWVGTPNLMSFTIGATLIF